jgi:plasmid rolling circle replication initiator protein Rep
MSALGSGDLLTLPIDDEQVNAGEYLSDVSPRHKPWDVHRGEADDVTEVYASSPLSRHQRYAMRVENCSQVLGFVHDPLATKKNKLKLTNALFCRVRHCPVCQWRRSLMWQAKVYQALPALMKDYPGARFLFLTLTIRNCEVKHLRVAFDLMGKGFKRLTELRSWPALGWVRAVEITRGKDGSAHLHYHVLLMVSPSYFQGDYLKQDQWAELWQQCLRINYRPVVDIRAVKLTLSPDSQRVNKAPKNMWRAVAEILKYAVKPSDMVRDHDWFLTLTDQLHKTRAVAIGGILKHYIKGRKKENLKSEPGEEPAEKMKEQRYFRWKPKVRKYQKVAPLRPGRG